MYKKREATLTSSYETQISQLERSLKEAQDENSRLREQLDRVTRKYEECKNMLIEHSRAET